MSRFSPQSLTRQFCRSVDLKNEPERVVGIRVPDHLYNAYIELYRASVRLSDALCAVMADGEHQLAMEEAAQAGHRLPDLETFETEARDYADFLKSFNPYQCLLRRNGEVILPMRTVALTQAMVHYNCLMVSRVLSGCFETEYLKHFTTLKNLEIAYAGPTALQQTFDLLAGLARTVEKHDNYILERQAAPPRLAL